MKKVTLKTNIPSNAKERDACIYWNLARAVRQNLLPKERIEKQINFVMANSKADFPELDQRFVNLRKLNRQREDDVRAA